MEYSYTGSSLFIHSSVEKKTIEFDYPIEQIEEVSGILVVLINAHFKFPQNVYGVNGIGEIVWQIPQPLSNVPFVNLYFDNGELVAGNWYGLEHYMNPQTGEVIRTVFMK